MNEIVLVCIVLVTVSVIVATVYFVITMIRMSQTAKKAEETLAKIDSEIETMQKISSSVENAVSFFPKTWIKVATAVLPVITGFLFKKKK